VTGNRGQPTFVKNAFTNPFYQGDNTMFPLDPKPLAAKTELRLVDKILKHLEFVLNNDALFDYVYRLIADQLQTEEILFESAVEETILELCKQPESQNHPEGLRANRTRKEGNPEVINPALIIALVTQIISIINTMKKK